MVTTTYEARSGSRTVTGTCLPGTVERNVWRAAYLAWGGLAAEPATVTLAEDTGLVVWTGTVHPEGHVVPA